ncbi:hypothetical protein KVR801_140014 [Klebsiella variicola]|nr:hypothetical protein KVR801_140014 [Klebsiella variicola]
MCHIEGHIDYGELISATATHRSTSVMKTQHN